MDGRLIGALGIGAAAAALFWAFGRGREMRRPAGLDPADLRDWQATRSAALAWTPPDPGLAGQPWDAPENAATVEDAMGLIKGGPLSGLFDRLFGGAGGKRQDRPASPVTVSTSGQASGIRPLLDLIGSVEAPRGYDDYYRGITTPPPRPLTQMTVGEVLAWQDLAVARGARSSAAGRYQIIRSTLRDLVRRGVISQSDLFSPAVQDRAALALMERRGLSAYQSGQMSAHDFATNLAKEWASLPDPRTGRSVYSGDGLNAALVQAEDVLQAVAAIPRRI